MTVCPPLLLWSKITSFNDFHSGRFCGSVVDVEGMIICTCNIFL